MWNPHALTPTEERRDRDSVTIKPSGADSGANSFGPNTMLSPLFSGLEFSVFPQHDIQIQGDGLSNPSNFKNVNNSLCFDLNSSTDSMANLNLTVDQNGMSEFNRESDVPYAGYPIKARGVEAKNSRIVRVPMPHGGNFGVRGNILNPATRGGAEVNSNRNFSTREIRSKLEEPVSISSSYKSFMVGQTPVNPPALTTTEERRDQDSVTTKPSGADEVANNFGPNTMLFPLFNPPEFADFPQHDIQIQGDTLSNLSHSKNLNNGLCFDLNGSANSMANPNLIVAQNGMSEFNRESDVPYDGYPIKARGVEAKRSRIMKVPMPLGGNFGVIGNSNSVHGNIHPAIGGDAEVNSNRNFSTREIRSKMEEHVSISSSYKSSMVGQAPVNAPALTTTGVQRGQVSVTTKPTGAGDGANSFGHNTMLSPLFNGLEYVFPQQDVQIQGDSLQNPSNFKNVNNGLCFDLNGSAAPNLIVAHNGMSEFNGESDVPYAGYSIKAQGTEAKKSRITRVPMPLGGNNGVRGNASSVHGNILNPAIGGGAEVNSNRNFSNREIRSILEEPVSIHSSYKSSMVGQSPVNTLNLAPYMGLGMGGQTNSERLSSPALAGSSRLNTIQFPGLEEQANPHTHFSRIYDEFSAMIPQRGHATQSPLSQISRPTALASQFVNQPQQHMGRSSASDSSETLMNYLSNMQGRSSISQAQLQAMRTQSTSGVRTSGSVGPVGSTNRGVTNICSPPSSAQPVGHSATSHNHSSVAALGNSFFPMPRVNTIHSTAGAGPSTTFPRMIVQPNYPTARDTPAIRSPAQAYGGMPLLRPGHQHTHGMLAQFPTMYSRPVNSSGIHLPGYAHPIRPIVSSGQVATVARPTQPQGSVVSQTHLKRRATENPSPSLLSQRRKIFPQPDAIHHYDPGPRPSFPVPAPVPSSSQIPPAHMYHIKCEDFDEPHKPSGHKCGLCKRDLKFPADGQACQPDRLPAVAILPCGHTFHDDCLQKITTEELSKEPPCIPCALGET